MKEVLTLPIKIDLTGTKYITTHDGSEVRIYATDARGDYPIHGAYWHPIKKCWFSSIWNDLGRHYLLAGLNLRDAPAPKREVWVNITSDESGMVYFNREEADAMAVYDRIACVRVEYTPGEGLDE